MRETILYSLYHTLVLAQEKTLRETPDYQWAMQEWEKKRNGDEIDQEDGASLRERAWGELSFAAGLNAGFRLAWELEALFGEEEL